MVEVAGSESIARRIHRLADDPSVKAIVVRIDSPGGDGSASDLIWRELSRARKEKGKPVVASMGDVAASGGYYVAVAADEIYAEPSTVTGSIGVFAGKFDLEELYRELGLKLTTVKRGKSADLFSTARALTDEERRTLQEWVDAFYGQFVDRVAEGRRLPRERGTPRSGAPFTRSWPSKSSRSSACTSSMTAAPCFSLSARRTSPCCSTTRASARSASSPPCKSSPVPCGRSPNGRCAPFRSWASRERCARSCRSISR